MDSLTFQFIPHQELSTLDSSERLARLLKVVKGNKIAILEGRLKAEEEAALIKRTMEEIDEKFKGVELAVIVPKSQGPLATRMRVRLADFVLGKRQGLTVIGPATIVREMKQDPEKIQLFTQGMAERSREPARKRAAMKAAKAAASIQKDSKGGE